MCPNGQRLSSSSLAQSPHSERSRPFSGTLPLHFELLGNANSAPHRFIGSITRNRRYVKSYSAVSIFLFLCSLVSAALFLFAVYTEKNVTITCSTTDAHGNVSIDNCGTHLTTAGKVVVTVISVLEIFVHLCAYAVFWNNEVHGCADWLVNSDIVVVIRRYVEQLEEDADFWQGPYKLTSTDANKDHGQTVSPYPLTGYGNA